MCHVSSFRKLVAHESNIPSCLDWLAVCNEPWKRRETSVLAGQRVGNHHFLGMSWQLSSFFFFLFPSLPFTSLSSPSLSPLPSPCSLLLPFLSSFLRSSPLLSFLFFFDVSGLQVKQEGLACGREEEWENRDVGVSRHREVISGFSCLINH